jgi:hypothetical protein
MIIARMSIQVTSCVDSQRHDKSEQPLKDCYDDFSTWPKVSSNGGSSLGAFIKFRRRRDENVENRFSALRRSSETFTARIQTFKETRQLSKGSCHDRSVTNGILSCLSPVSSKKSHTHVSAHLADWSVNDTGQSEQRAAFPMRQFVSYMLVSKGFEACLILINSKVEPTSKDICLQACHRRTVAYERFKTIQYCPCSSTTWHFQLYMLSTFCKMRKVKARCSCVVASRNAAPSFVLKCTRSKLY